MKSVLANVLLLLSLFPEIALTQASRPGVPLAKLLNPDGTINFSLGVQGSVDAQGFRMNAGPHGEPMFIRSPQSPMYLPGDEAWSDRFGISGSSDILIAVAIDGSNLYVGGGDMNMVPGDKPQHIVKWDGYQWTALGSGVKGDVDAITIVAGMLYAGGIFDSAGGVSVHNIARWDGATWSALGSGMNGRVDDIVVIGSDLYVGGLFTDAGGTTVNHIAKWNGASWSALGSGTDDGVHALAVNGSDLYVGGVFTSAGGVAFTSKIAKWNGAAWSALGLGIGTGPASAVWSLQFMGSDLYAGGEFTTAGTSNARNIAKWNGSTWSSLGSGTNAPVLALATDGSNIFVGGQFDTVGGFMSDKIARWNGSTWLPMNPIVSAGEVTAMCFGGGNLYVVGQFQTLGGQAVRGIAYWDGSSWFPMPGNGMNSPVEALATSGNRIYAGGTFVIGGVVPVWYVGEWNDTIWTSLDGGVDSTVFALAISGNDLYVGGAFQITRGGINPSMSVNHIAKWNGTSWSTLGAGIDGPVYAITVKGSDVYAGGSFLTASGVPANNVAKWDGVNWSALGDGLDNTVYALAINDSGLFAGGIFTTSGTFATKYLARWDGSSWTAPGGGMNLPVFALVARGNDIYAGGMFTMAGPLPAGHVARWDGAAWSTVGVTGTNGTVYALAADSGHLVAGGEFGLADTVSTYNIAKWNDTAWSAMGSGVGNVDRALTIRGVDIFAGGDFMTAGSWYSYHIGEWQGDKVVKKVEETIPINSKWNMVSVAVAPDDSAKSALFPNAISNAFTYQGSYVAQDRLTPGIGYWIKFADSGGVSMSGYQLTTLAIHVEAGWNMIGSISQTILASSVVSDPPGLLTSQFFQYHGSYSPTSMIKPGMAYWVKVAAPGTLTLSSAPSMASSAGRINVEAIAETPPLPPADESAAAGPRVPHEFRLTQNYPNPFNPTTTIHYDIPQQSSVRLTVVDLLGREITVLVASDENAGPYDVSWNAIGVASGIYFYRLEAHSSDGSRHFIEQQKMALIK